MSGVTTANLGDNLIPKRMNIGGINHLTRERNKVLKNAMIEFEKEKQKNGYARFKDVLDKIQEKQK